jgi:hypothetical protein
VEILNIQVSHKKMKLKFLLMEMVMRNFGVVYQFRNYEVFKDDCIMDLIMLQEIRAAHYITEVLHLRIH